MDKDMLKFLQNQNMKKHRKIYDSKEGHKIKCVHEDGCFPVIGKLVRDFNPSLILELGFSWGGMTKLFEDYTYADIHAYNKPCKRKPKEKIFGYRVTFHWCDLLSTEYLPLVELCKDKRKKLLYCDNGNKVKEVYMYGKYLNVGDMIAAHDYPREIYEDYDLLPEKTQQRVSREDIERMNEVLKDFEPIKHNSFLEKGLSDRFWIKASNG